MARAAGSSCSGFGGRLVDRRWPPLRGRVRGLRGRSDLWGRDPGGTEGADAPRRRRPLPPSSEATALRLAGGEGCPVLYRYDPDRGALLMERLGRSMYELGLPLS